ncbi:unnamed protein product [marine sediment metagenome]|uniref:Helix-turn-helix domain-containing protein n=1 Tax=marine sediment metagenome TaxID=412755 RepID=X0XL86_9ZZZZ
MLLTTQQVAEKLKVTRGEILRLITVRRLPARKQGRDWVIREKDLKKVEYRKVGRPRKIVPKIVLRYGE